MSTGEGRTQMVFRDPCLSYGQSVHCLLSMLKSSLTFHRWCSLRHLCHLTGWLQKILRTKLSSNENRISTYRSKSSRKSYVFCPL